MQTTLKDDVPLVGIGLHSGRPARVTLRPAAADSGVRFRRVDLSGCDTMIPARYDLVSDTTLNTRLTNAAGVSVSTIEHLMAAIAGTGLHNVLVDIDGPEIPIMDGSARRFVRGILSAGLRRLDAPISAWAVMKTVTLEEGDVTASLSPFSGLTIDFTIDFPDAAIGRQTASMNLSNGTFIRELADCRTFCRRAEVDYMQSRGLALGGTLENAVVIDGDQVLNPEGFRRRDECVRHKMLDALGDLALAGAPVLGAYRGVRAGHGPTNRLLRKAFATPGAMARVTVDAKIAGGMPGFQLVAADLAAVG
ncbi:UDP-3-O-acyl-N-acetylglucosamine deacetylase [Oceanibium sediminis]|uniref:UDP-3-O-acyl-N-acetylglucosamine deacetylase n=1 Tax=Oceanibium sediminis TaxID=2026339 RepID=UPI000DD3305F|nr:UDP-3-O-acyl-N-acetylglucosamine deacetylase [Oceanibium sediminis]